MQQDSEVTRRKKKDDATISLAGMFKNVKLFKIYLHNNITEFHYVHHR